MTAVVHAGQRIGDGEVIQILLMFALQGLEFEIFADIFEGTDNAGEFTLIAILQGGTHA